MLQEEDPTGEGHIRMSGGVPFAAISKEGYWDGAYQYIDSDGNFVTSTRDYKVDIYCKDIYDFVSDMVDMHDPDNFEKIKSKFKFELDYANAEQRKEKEESVFKEVKVAWDQDIEIELRLYNKSLDEMRQNAKLGWKWFQNKLVDTVGKEHHHYTWKIFDENNKSMGGSNLHMTECVLNSGEWEKLDNNIIEGYYEWRLKIN